MLGSLHYMHTVSLNCSKERYRFVVTHTTRRVERPLTEQPDAELDFCLPLCQDLNRLCACVYLELSCRKSSMSVLLIPQKQTTDFSVSFWDYLDSRTTLGILITFEMCGHMLKCQKMSLQSTQ